ncbi:MAG: hypothetical protein V4664_00725 [Patescibacteria group bacterium]
MDSKSQPIDVLQEVKSLNFPIDQFIIVGSSILSIKGIRPTYDLDIVVSQELFDRCKGEGWEEKEWTWPVGNKKGWLKSGIVELTLECVTDKEVFDLQSLITEADVIEGINFMGLRWLLNFKKWHGRPKDLEDIILIKNYLRDL